MKTAREMAYEAERLSDPRVEGRYLVTYESDDLPVTNLFNGPEPVTELEHAAAFVAGPTPDGAWLCGEVVAFDIRERAQ